MQEKKHYVNKKELNEAVIAYKESGSISKKLAQMLSSICEHYARHPNFKGYVKTGILDDLISEGYLACIKALKSYTPINENDEENNGLAYFTQCAKNAFKTFLNKHYGNENFKREMLVDYCHENGIPFVDSVGEYLNENNAEKSKKLED